MSGALWAGVGFGLFQASNRRASRHMDVLLSTFLQIVVGAVVLAVTMVSVPVTILLSPIAVGRHIEHVTPRLWAGACVIVGGSLLLVWYG